MRDEMRMLGEMGRGEREERKRKGQRKYMGRTDDSRPDGLHQGYLLKDSNRILHYKSI